MLHDLNSLMRMYVLLNYYTDLSDKILEDQNKKFILFIFLEASSKFDVYGSTCIERNVVWHVNNKKAFLKTFQQPQWKNIIFSAGIIFRFDDGLVIFQPFFVVFNHSKAT